MKLTNPSGISGKILTLLNKSDEQVTIVSPYMKISKWYKLINKLNDLRARSNDLRARSIPIEIFVRDNHRNETTFNDMDQLELKCQKKYLKNVFAAPYLETLHLNIKALQCIRCPTRKTGGEEGGLYTLNLIPEYRMLFRY